MPADDVKNVSVTCTVDTFTVGGPLTGLLSGGSVVLQANGTLDQALTSDGPFVFPPLADGSAYTVTLAAQPAGQTCTATNDSGQLAGADVSNITVRCALFYEGIPVLDRYGLTLLVLLMLSAGFVGVRRIA